MRLSSAWISRAEGRSGRRGGRASRRQRLVHDPPDGTRAPPALGAAGEATIDLAGRARRLRSRNRTHVMVAEHVARAHDHGRAQLPGRRFFSSMCNYIVQPGQQRKAENAEFYRYSNLCGCRAKNARRRDGFAPWIKWIAEAAVRRRPWSAR